MQYCTTMSAARPDPSKNPVDQFVERVQADCIANGRGEHTSNEKVYRILDGIMAGRDATTASVDSKADRRRRAVKRSRERVGYP